MGDQAIDLKFLFQQQIHCEIIGGLFNPIPLLHAVSIEADQVNLLISDRRQIHMHGFQADAGQHHSPTGPRPAKTVLHGFPGTDAIIDHVEATQDHTVFKLAGIKLAGGNPGGCFIGIFLRDDFISAHLSGHLRLLGVTGHCRNVTVRGKRA